MRSIQILYRGFFLGVLLVFLASCGAADEEFAVELDGAATATEPLDRPAEAEAEAVEVTRVVTEVVEEPIEATRPVKPALSPTLAPQSSPTAAATFAPLTTATVPVPQSPIPEATSIPPTQHLAATATAAATRSPRPSRSPIAAATLVPPSPAPTTALPTIRPTTPVEERLAEVEWPERMRLGDSDVVRLAIIPAAEGYVVTAEFPDHQTVTGTVTVARPPGYDLAAAASLDGIGFTISPEGDQMQDWLPENPIVWQWAISPERTGRQRLVANLVLHWLPQPGNTSPARQSTAFSKALDIRVATILGMTTQQVLMTGILGLFLGIVLNVPLFRRWRTGRPPLTPKEPNMDLVIEPHPDISLTLAEKKLLRSLFSSYSRLTFELEFRSGYSGARALLARPIHADGRADAYTIAKLGDQGIIRREYENYKTFVEHTLPPITARIQDRPVTVRRRPLSSARAAGMDLAALRYTFIGQPGQKPKSLREELLARSAPALLETLFRTFGPNWWMQRRPYTFRLVQEYDRKLPSHYILEPAGGKGRLFDGRAAPAEYGWAVGNLVKIRHFDVIERKAEGTQLSLRGTTQPGQAPLRLRWLSSTQPNGATARVVATRDSLLEEWTTGFNRQGLPDPLQPLPVLLNEQISGSRSIIHGDLNLENILVGPGEFVWLIDFASTREGHPLFDFAHLGAEILAHVLTPQAHSPADFMALLDNGGGPLLQTLENMARRCLFDADQPREYHLALYMSCLGALKYGNLDPSAKHHLYLTAAFLTQGLVDGGR